MFKSFKFFAGDVYHELSDQMKKAYGSEAKHLGAYLKNNGFTPWLESFRGETLTMNEMYSVVDTYMKYGSREFSDLPAVFSSLSNEYDVGFPEEEGITTADYWENQGYYNNEDSLGMG